MLLGHLLEHGDLARAVRGERRSVPARPAFPEAETGDSRHQVQLGRPDVSVGSRVVDQAAFHLHPVMRPGDLPDKVVEGLDPEMVRFVGEHPCELSSGNTAQLGDDHLHHEASTRLEVGGGVGEDGELFLLGRDVS